MTFVLAVLRALVRIFVAASLWAWFCVPLGLPALSLGQMAGLWLLAVVVRPGRLERAIPIAASALSGVPADEQASRAERYASAGLIGYDLWVLAVGWVVSL